MNTRYSSSSVRPCPNFSMTSFTWEEFIYFGGLGGGGGCSPLFDIAHVKARSSSLSSLPNSSLSELYQ